MMDELTRFCATCQARQEIVSIVTDTGSTATTMACGHRIFTKEVNDTLGTLERLDDLVKREGKTIHKGMYRDKTSGETKRPTRESLTFDWKTRTKYHKVEEIQDDGTWKLMHEHTDPFVAERPKR